MSDTFILECGVAEPQHDRRQASTFYALAILGFVAYCIPKTFALKCFTDSVPFYIHVEVFRLLIGEWRLYSVASTPA